MAARRRPASAMPVMPQSNSMWYSAATLRHVADTVQFPEFLYHGAAEMEDGETATVVFEGVLEKL